jgi:SAM-dependent methyltransferase
MRKFPVQLDDRALQEFNDMLPWFAGMALPDGRVLGKVGTRENKRDVLETVPDKRIVRLNAEVGLAGKSVLELGCFEGLHTLGLRMFSSDVTAVDIRAVNVLKTLARLSAFGTSANVFQFDVETIDANFPDYDVIFHCGVLYHLEDPVAHLLRLLPHCRAMYLDTHVAPPGANDTLVSTGETYQGHRFVEGGWADPFSGRAPEAFWLLQSDIITLFERHGFATTVWSERAERNGPRIGLLAIR